MGVAPLTDATGQTCSTVASTATKAAQSNQRRRNNLLLLSMFGTADLEPINSPEQIIKDNANRHHQQ
jgi:hypothetical protein